MIYRSLRNIPAIPFIERSYLALTFIYMFTHMHILICICFIVYIHQGFIIYKDNYQAGSLVGPHTILIGFPLVHYKPELPVCQMNSLKNASLESDNIMVSNGIQ